MIKFALGAVNKRFGGQVGQVEPPQNHGVHNIPCWLIHYLEVIAKASSSIGRAAVSKTAGWGFDSLLACQRA